VADVPLDDADTRVDGTAVAGWTDHLRQSTA
jgi:hypothetical protein